MKKILFLFLLITSASIAFAQDDDLPPPSSKPKTETTIPAEQEQTPPNPQDFQGFKAKKKKLDLSKFIIEPIVILSIGQGIIRVGLSPYVGYKVWEPKSEKAKRGNSGLFVGAGFTYFYTQLNQLQEYNGRVFSIKTKEHTYGGGVFVQYNIWRGFFARAKMEIIQRSIDYPTSATFNPTTNGIIVDYIKINKTLPSLLIGAGYNLLQSKNIFIPVVISYNVLHSITDKQYSIYPRGVTIQLGFITLL